MKRSPNGAVGAMPAVRNRQPQRKAPARSAVPTGDSEDKIRAAAYALYEARGHLEGHALEDWLQAEQQVGLSHRASGSA